MKFLKGYRQVLVSAAKQNLAEFAEQLINCLSCHKDVIYDFVTTRYSNDDNIGAAAPTVVSRSEAHWASAVSESAARE